ncbi:hypothetical protein [Mycobacterium sp. HM-7]
MTDTLVAGVALGMVIGVTLLLRSAFRHLVRSTTNPVERDEQIAELIAHHWVDADLPDRYIDPEFRCGGCNFVGPTRLHHARHIAAAIRRLDDADQRVVVQLQGRSRSP